MGCCMQGAWLHGHFDRLHAGLQALRDSRQRTMWHMATPRAGAATHPQPALQVLDECCGIHSVVAAVQQLVHALEGGLGRGGKRSEGEEVDGWLLEQAAEPADAQQ